MSELYRVSSMQRTERTIGRMTAMLAVYEQCGCFYYFSKLDNACKAAKEFNSGIDILPFNSQTTTSDHWYE